ncbi:MAG TPA: SPOR domain-containing protein [Flavilitoribacter sp.]|nr:SPOR domain-containing protein [Flavilitoribacter sp.]
MSRLDFFTLIIVGVLLFALGFLIYRATQLPKEQTAEQTEQGVPDSDNTNNTTAGTVDTSTVNTPGNAAASDDEDLDDDEVPAVSEEKLLAEKVPAQKANEPSAKPRDYNSSSSGNFLVIAGSFRQKANAEAQVKRLKKSGYDQSGVETFNNGALAVAMVDRFNSYAEAEKLVAELKKKGIDAFIKKKE